MIFAEIHDTLYNVRKLNTINENFQGQKEPESLMKNKFVWEKMYKHSSNFN